MLMHPAMAAQRAENISARMRTLSVLTPAPGCPRRAHERISVEERHAVAVRNNLQCFVQRRRAVQGYLCRPVNECREPPAGIAAIRGFRRPAESLCDFDLSRTFHRILPVP
jgi:hypothetical protein